MIADALYADMVTQSARLRRENPLLRKAAEGTLTAEQVAHYLVNVLHLLRHTPTFLERAQKRALEAGELALAEHYAQKAKEEEGHDRWAERDVSRMMRCAPDAKHEIVSGLREMMSLTLAVIEEHPALILAYMFFNETLIVLLGDEFLANLEARCGIPRTSMTAVGNHVELDRDHVDEALATIDSLVADPQMLPRMREVLHEAIFAFERFSSQIAGDNDGASLDSEASQDADVVRRVA